MTKLDFFRRVTHSARGISKKKLLLLRSHQPEKYAWLVVVVFIYPMIPVIGRSFQTQRRFCKFRLLLAVAIWFIIQGTALVAANQHSSVAMVAVKWAAGSIYRYKRITQEKYGCIVAYKVPISLLGIKLKSKTPYIPLCIGSATNVIGKFFSFFLLFGAEIYAFGFIINFFGTSQANMS